MTSNMPRRQPCSSSGYGNAGAFFVTGENLWQAAIVFAVRRLIKPTWLNDRDQFLQPSEPLSDTFTSDCLIWMLFNGSNLTAGADGLHWNGRDWSLTNHFHPLHRSRGGREGAVRIRFHGPLHGGHNLFARGASRAR